MLLKGLAVPGSTVTWVMGDRFIVGHTFFLNSSGVHVRPNECSSKYLRVKRQQLAPTLTSKLTLPVDQLIDEIECENLGFA